MGPIRRLVNTVTDRINPRSSQDNRSSGSQGQLGGRSVTKLTTKQAISKYAQTNNRIADLQEKISEINVPGNTYLDQGFDATKLNLGDAKKEIKRLRFTIAFNKKDRKYLKDAKKALKYVKTAKRKIEQLKAERKNIEGEFSKINKDSPIELLKYQLSLGATKGPVILDCDQFTLDELIDLVMDLKNDSALLEAGRRSMEHCEDESQARDAKLVVTGTLDMSKARAVRQLAETLMSNPKVGKLVSVAKASIPEGEDGKKVLEELANGGEDIKLDKSTTQKPPHVIAVKCSIEQLKQLDNLAIENHDSSMETPQTIASLKGKADERMEHIKFEAKKKGAFADPEKHTFEITAKNQIKVKPTPNDSITSTKDGEMQSFSVTIHHPLFT